MTIALEGGTPVRADRLPLHRPWFDAREADAMHAVLRSTHVAGDGASGREFERLLRESSGALGALAVNSCTAALEVAVEVAGLGPGDEVILPSYTFVSTANAVLRSGARPVFAEIDPRRWVLDPEDVESRITPHTRAVFLMHYAGMASDMVAFEAIAARHGLLLLEDAAHCANAWFRGRALGAWGAIGALSFHETKDIVCGEGGALLVRDDQAMLHRAEIIREKGTDRTAFLRGERSKYTWVDLGSSYVLSELLAAIALEQFHKIQETTRRKTRQAERLLEALTPYQAFVQRPVVPDDCRPNWHVFAVLVPPDRRDWVIRALRAEGISAAFHYVPLHSAPFAQQHPDIAAVDLPVTDRIAASLVRLPISAAFTDADSQDVVTACRKVFDRLGDLRSRS
jgi:dTDP-4-amino-4,6-dideoxygalactose transaminase